MRSREDRAVGVAAVLVFIVWLVMVSVIIWALISLVGWVVSQ